MDLKSAKQYYNLGVLEEMIITRSSDAAGKACWILVITGNKGQSWTLQTVLGKDKEYASIDTAAKDMEAICDKVSSLVFKL